MGFDRIFRSDLAGMAVVAAFGFLIAVSGTAASGHWKETHRLVPDDADPENETYFGRSVAVSGSTLVVGAHWDDEGANTAGAVYVFDAATGEQLHKLIAEDASWGAGLGFAVAVSGSTIVVGAPFCDDLGTHAGSAYVFDANTGEQLHKLTGNDTEAGDQFGFSVSIFGNKIVIGASQDDHAGRWSGSAYVFDATTGQQLHKLTAYDAAEDDWYGWSVATDGELVVVGCPNDDDACEEDPECESGAAYVYSAANGQFLYKLTAAEAEWGDQMALAVAISDNRIFMNSRGDDDACPSDPDCNSGAVYVFDAVTGEEIRKLKASDPTAEVQFGYALSASNNTVVVSTRYEELFAYNGAVYLFDIGTGKQLRRLTPEYTETEVLGGALGISGNTLAMQAGSEDLGRFVLLFDQLMPPCIGDITGPEGVPNGTVDVVDLLLVLANWGEAADAGDITGSDGEPDGIVDVLDLIALLGQWGPCPEIPFGMTYVPGGEIEMGCHEETGEVCESDELPVHSVHVDSFYADVHEVTTSQYCEYLNAAHSQGLIQIASGVVYKADDSEPYCNTVSASSYSRLIWDGSVFTFTEGKGAHPVTEVSWYGAVAYSNWLSAAKGYQLLYDLETWERNPDADGYRLPTEAEWEYAARGGEVDPYFQYPWGYQADGSKANYYASGDPFESGAKPRTTPVGYFDGQQSPDGLDMINGYGLHDAAGNVFEWCGDWYGAEYYEISAFDNPLGPLSGTERVLRGGSWNDESDEIRNAYRFRMSPDARAFTAGFRLVRKSP